MGLKVTNNAFGTLNAGINSSATTIVLTAGQGARFPSLSAGDYFYATLIDTSNNLEIVKVTARSTDTMTVVRGQDSTTARAYSTNDRFELRPTAALFNEKANDADVAATYLPKAGGTMTGALVLTTPSSTGGVASLRNGSTNTGLNKDYQAEFGFDGSAGYRHYLRTRHNSAAQLGNAFDFFVSDTTANGGFGTARRAFTIDAAGNTQPFQPAFFARPSSDPTNGVVICNLVDFNIGGHYNSSNGRFTAPIDGIYYFSAITNGGAGTSTIALRFRKNQVTVPGFQAYIMNVDDSPNISGIMSLTSGDYVDLVTDATSIASTPWTHFCGYFLG